MLKGHTVLECHSLEHALRNDCELKHVHFMRQTLSWLPRCDALYLIGHSPGANIELSYARELGLPVFERLADVPDIPIPPNELAELTTRIAEEARALGLLTEQYA
jgi:uncharacterized protein DUF4406